MATLQARAFKTVQGGSGFARAKKLADLAIEKSTDESGKTTAQGLQQAIAMLEPFMSSSNEGIDAQRIVADYGNKLRGIKAKELEQNETVSSFQRQEDALYFVRDDDSFRDPSVLISDTSVALDSLILSVHDAIDEGRAQNKDVDGLLGYLDKLNKRGDAMRDLREKAENGMLGNGQSLNGFGYYVDTDPMTGDVRGAAIVPTDNAPDGVVSGFKRLGTTANVRGALLPVYAPAQKDANGKYVSKVGETTWSGSDSKALAANETGRFESFVSDGGFTLSDKNSFPIKEKTLSADSFGTGIIGRDVDGMPVHGLVYKSRDNNVYQIDDETRKKMEADPVMGSKLNGYIPRFSPEEFKQVIKTAKPFDDEIFAKESAIATMRNQTARMASDLAKDDGRMSIFKDAAGYIGSKLRAGAQALDSSFQQSIATPSVVQRNPETRRVERVRNTPNKPDEASGVGNSGADIVDSGSGFFRKAANFFTRK